MVNALSFSTAPSLSEIADGRRFRLRAADGGWCVNNAGVIVHGGTTVLVDTAATESRTRRLRQAVERVSHGGPDILVNTHHHGDHTFGNSAVRRHGDDCRARAGKVGDDRGRVGLRNVWPDVDWGRTPLTLPTLTFRESITLHAGDLRL